MLILSRLSKALREQNWFAVGIEFIIVIAGIVIGFQIQAWNEARQERIREGVYLTQLMTDLESDERIAERGIDFADQIDAAADQLLILLEDGPGAEAISDARLVVSVLLAGYAYLPSANNGTYQEMISTGALSLVRDAELKRALATYYSRADSSRQWDRLVREEQSAYRAAIRGLLTRDQFAWARARIASARQDEPLDFDRTAFIEEARARPGIIDSLRSMGEDQERLRGDSRMLKQQAETLRAQLRTALGKPQTAVETASSSSTISPAH